MIDMADYGRIVAFKKQGRNVSEIAREVGCSRNTVYGYLSGKRPEYQRKDSGVKLDPYKGFITAKLKESILYTATRLFREIKEMGYSGGYTMVKVYVRKLKESANKESIIRFETTPGKQAQVDWGEVKGKEPSGRTFKRYFLLLTLGYSRKRYLKFAERMDVFALLSCLKSGLEFMGGVPAEILSDNMTTMVTDRMVPYSLVEQYLRCGNKKCRCHTKGILHGPYHCLTQHRGGKTKNIYIPKEHLSRISPLAERYKTYETSLTRVRNLNQQILGLLKEIEESTFLPPSKLNLKTKRQRTEERRKRRVIQ